MKLHCIKAMVFRGSSLAIASLVISNLTEDQMKTVMQLLNFTCYLSELCPLRYSRQLKSGLNISTHASMGFMHLSGCASDCNLSAIQTKGKRKSAKTTGLSRQSEGHDTFH